MCCFSVCWCSRLLLVVMYCWQVVRLILVFIIICLLLGRWISMFGWKCLFLVFFRLIWVWYFWFFFRFVCLSICFSISLFQLFWVFWFLSVWVRLVVFLFRCRLSCCRCFSFLFREKCLCVFCWQFFFICFLNVWMCFFSGLSICFRCCWLVLVKCCLCLLKIFFVSLVNCVCNLLWVDCRLVRCCWWFFCCL